MRALILVSLMMGLVLPMAAQGRSQAQSQPANCSVTLNDLDFGRYNFLDTTPRTAIGSVLLNCPPQAPANVTVRISSGRSGQPLDRYMSNGSHRLSYNLFVDPSHTIVAGDGFGGTQPLRQPSGSGAVQTYRLFGLIPPRQAVAAGGYMDTLIVEIEF